MSRHFLQHLPEMKTEKCRVVSRYLPQSKDVDLKCHVVSRHLPTIRVSREDICISLSARDKPATHRWNSLSDGRLGHIVLRADGPATTHLCTFLHKIRCLLHNFACKNRDVLAPFCTFGALSCKCHVESRHLPMNVCVNVYVVSRHMPKKLWFKT